MHLGAALAKFHQQKVLLIDFDAQANLTAGLGYDPDAHDSIASVLQGTKNIHEVILPSGIANLDLIPADTYLERVEVRELWQLIAIPMSALNKSYIFCNTMPLL